MHVDRCRLGVDMITVDQGVRHMTRINCVPPRELNRMRIALRTTEARDRAHAL